MPFQTLLTNLDLKLRSFFMPKVPKCQSETPTFQTFKKALNTEEPMVQSVCPQLIHIIGELRKDVENMVHTQNAELYILIFGIRQLRCK